MSKYKNPSPQTCETEEVKKPEQIIYIGPTKSGIKTNTIFTAELPETAKTLIKRDAKYKRLFVPLSEFPKVKIALKNGGLAEIYKSAVNEKI